MSDKRGFLEHDLSRRERQIMQAVYRLGEATVAEIVHTIPEPPTADSIRRLCHILENKGHLGSVRSGTTRVYRPTVRRSEARQAALHNMIETFFGGSERMLAATLLDSRRNQLSPEDVHRLTRMIEEVEEDQEP